MATIKDLYDKHLALEAGQGGPDAPKVDANLQIDKSPYSVGLGKGEIDEPAINKLATTQTKAPYAAAEGGNWYGIKGSNIGTGTTFTTYPYINGSNLARASSSDLDKYSKQIAPYRV